MPVNTFIPLVDKMSPEYKKNAQDFIKEGLRLGYWKKIEVSFIGEEEFTMKDSNDESSEDTRGRSRDKG